MTSAQSVPLLRDCAQVDAPGVLPARALALRPPMPHAAWRRMNWVIAVADAASPHEPTAVSFTMPSPPNTTGTCAFECGASALRPRPLSSIGARPAGSDAAAVG